MRHGCTRVVTGFENGCGSGHRLRRKFIGGVGGRRKDDGHQPQACGEDRVGLVTAARQPVWFRQQEIDADDARRPRRLDQPGKLVTRPRPLTDVTDGVAVDVNDQDAMFWPRGRPTAFVRVEHPVAQIRQRAVRCRVSDQDDSQAKQRCHNPWPRRTVPDSQGAGQAGRRHAGRDLCQSGGTSPHRHHN